MKRIWSALLLSALALALCYLPACARGPLTAPGASAFRIVPTGRLSPEQAAEILKRFPDGALAILDVRTAKEFAAGHAPGAVHIPLQELQERLSEVPPAPLLILCRSGIRAGKAYDLLISGGRPAERIWYLKGYTEYEDGALRFHN
ncbi:MAG: rhodanese-like domain-containing protein [Mailhella sp.]|nr:rhodanese-like domain-containing protein [Mailhella sp.]